MPAELSKLTRFCVSGSSEEDGDPDSASRSGPAEVQQADKPFDTTQDGRNMLLSKFAEAMQRQPSGDLAQEQPVKESSPDRRKSLLPLERVNGHREGSGALTASRSSGGLSLQDPATGRSHSLHS